MSDSPPLTALKSTSIWPSLTWGSGDLIWTKCLSCCFMTRPFWNALDHVILFFHWFCCNKLIQTKHCRQIKLNVILLFCFAGQIFPHWAFRLDVAARKNLSVFISTKYKKLLASRGWLRHNDLGYCNTFKIWLDGSWKWNSRGLDVFNIFAPGQTRMSVSNVMLFRKNIAILKIATYWCCTGVGTELADQQTHIDLGWSSRKPVNMMCFLFAL